MTRPERTASAAGAVLVLALLTGCAAQQLVSVRDEVARRKAPIHTAGGQAIRGSFDGHGRYRPLPGRIRERDGALQLRTQVDLSRDRWVTVSRDSVKTIMAARSRALLYAGIFLAPAGVVVLKWLGP